MKYSLIRVHVRKMFVMVLLGLTFMMQACGSTVDKINNITDNIEKTSNEVEQMIASGVYITDKLNARYNQLLSTIYNVKFTRSADGSRIVAFDSTTGITYDLCSLNGIVKQLPNSSVPAGDYSSVVITVSEDMMVVLSDGTTLNPLLSSSSVVGCSSGKCMIEIPVTTVVADGKRVVLDFDLSQYSYDNVSNTMFAKVLLDEDGSEHSEYFEEIFEDHDIEGIITALNSNSFDMRLTEVKGFMPDSTTMTVTLDSSTLFTCDDENTACTITSIDNLAIGMEVEVYAGVSGTQFIAARVEVDAGSDHDSGSEDHDSGHDDHDED